MIEVQRFNVVGYKAEDGCFVNFSDYKTTQSELAALREELAESGKADHLRQRIAFLTTEIHKQAERLAAAEQQNAELMALMARVEDHFKFWSDHAYAEVLHGVIEDYRKIKPTESGASE